MALTGKPAIGSPNALDLRAIQGAISNARQRIEQIEAAVNAASAAAPSTASTNNLLGQLASLQGRVSSLEARVTVLETASSTDLTTLTAAEDIAAFVPVVPFGEGSCAIADASDPTAMFAVIGISVAGVSAGAQINIQRRGPLTVPGAAFEAGRAVYVDAAGLTQAPSYESTAIPVGVATGADTMWVAPDWPALSAIPFASAVGDGFLRYLPVTYGVTQDAIALAEALLAQPDGFVVKVGDEFVTRVLVGGSGSGITIVDGDGADDPRFTVP